ncbi:MAG: T9SS type A sorting domain-containing protein [Flavobacteriales bacterium]|nr:T9SS type A sorting domain-containing protein [Flavobacteriales bacterium]
MKSVVLIFSFLFTSFLFSQIVNIPDANFKAKLLEADVTNTIAKDADGNNLKIDTNNDGEIQEDEAENIEILNVSGSSISDLVGIEFFINLVTLDCSSNNLTSLNISKNINLVTLVCFRNNLFLINFVNNPKLEYIIIYANNFEELNINNLPMLKHFQGGDGVKKINFSGSNNIEKLDIEYSELSEFNFSQFTKLKELVFWNNLFIETINLSNLKFLESVNIGFKNFRNLILKNNKVQIVNLYSAGGLSPSIKYICVDEEEFEYVSQQCLRAGIDAEINSYCSFEPAGEKNTILGKTAINCEAEQRHSIKIKKEDGTGTGYLFSNENGEYKTYGGTRTYTLTPIFEHPYYTISPTYKEITFTDLGNTEIVDFCIQPIANKNDLEVKIIPVRGARPGFDAEYKIVYKNKGTTTLNGNLEFYFNDNLSDYIPNPAVTPFQENGKLTFDYTDLKPFESRTILVTLNINPPTETIEIPVNGGDILTYNTIINPTTNDETPNDNTFELKQTVVNSYDPNDKTCLQGTSITPNLIGEYVDYLIRFENTGSAEAINIVVKDIIDTSMFDVSTLIPTDSSHDYELRIDGNKVEFIFEGINLPFDDANNDGYVAFKIKTLPTVTLGDELKNKADIYFDFNFPIETNEYVTTVETLSSEEILRQAQNDVSFFPNPASEKVTFNEEVQSVQIFNLSGQLLQTSIVNGTELNISELKAGNYILKITTKKGIAIEKLIKN